MDLPTKQGDSQTQNMNLWLLGGGDTQGLLMDMYALIFKMYKQQGPIGQRMELCSMLCAAWTGGEFGEEWIHVYV